MKSHSNSHRAIQATPLVSLLAVVVTVLVALVVYQQFFSSGAIEMGPFMMWLAITIPAGIFGCIFLQVHAAERAKQVSQNLQAHVSKLEMESRNSPDTRLSAKVQLDRPLLGQDPFENL